MQNKGGLKHKFEGFGAQPSETLWDSIASNLDQKKKRRVIIFWWLGSAFSVGILVFFGVDYFTNGRDVKLSSPTSKNTTFVPKQNTFHSNNTIEFVDSEQTDLLDSNSTVMDESNLALNQTSIEKQNVTTQNNSPQVLLNKLSTETIVLNDSQINEKKSIENVEEKSHSTPQKQVDITKLNIPLWTELPVVFYSQLGKNDIEIPPSTSNWIYSLNVQTQKGFKFPKSLYDTPNETALASNNQDLFFQNPIQLRPLTLRFGMAKQFKKRLSFQTGIDLGWIQSNGNASKSTIFSLGIPVKLNLTLIERKKGAFYSNFGLVNDIPLFELTRNFNGYKYEIASSKIVTGFLGGTELGLGFNYKLSEHLKFDVNSGFKWYYYQSAKTNNPINSQNVFLTFNAGIIWNY